MMLNQELLIIYRNSVLNLSVSDATYELQSDFTALKCPAALHSFFRQVWLTQYFRILTTECMHVHAAKEMGQCLTYRQPLSYFKHSS